MLHVRAVGQTTQLPNPKHRTFEKKIVENRSRDTRRNKHVNGHRYHADFPRRRSGFIFLEVQV